jgi:hypothetical protein
MHRSTDIDPVTSKKRGVITEILIPLAVLGAWIILQVWVLPKFGVRT